MSELKIRNLDAVTIAKLDEMATKRHMSREAFLRWQLSRIAMLDDLVALESQYEQVVNAVLKVLGDNTAVLQQLIRQENFSLHHQKTTNKPSAT